MTDIPKIGDLATFCIGSDRYPYEVIFVSESGNTIKLRSMSYEIVEGSVMNGTARYSYYRNKNGDIMKATLRKDGKYRCVGCRNYGTVYIGHADAYMDPHF